MNNMPKKLRKELAADPFYATCARAGLFDGNSPSHGYHRCEGRITWDHSVTFAGRQVQARWAITPLCARAHSVDAFQDGGDLNKKINLWIALNRASDEALEAVSGATDYLALRGRLNAVYGNYKEPVLV